MMTKSKYSIIVTLSILSQLLCITIAWSLRQTVGMQPLSRQLKTGTTCRGSRLFMNSEKKNVDPILVRAYRGEEVDRSPVWLMRQVS